MSAPLTELTALTVADACRRHGVTEVIASGGGTRNPVLWSRLSRALGIPLRTVDELGLPSEAKEAYAFAFLGWLAAPGLPGSLPSVTGAATAGPLGSWTPAPPPVGATMRLAPRRLVITPTSEL